MRLQRRIRAPDAVQRRNFADNVAWGAQIANTYLIFLRIHVLFTAWQWSRLTQLEPRVHAPQAGQRAGERGTDQKGRAPAGLQQWWVDVWSIDEEVGAEQVTRRRR